MKQVGFSTTFADLFFSAASKPIQYMGGNKCAKAAQEKWQ